MSMGLSIGAGLARRWGGVSAITDAAIAALLNGVSGTTMLVPGVGMYQDTSLTAAGNGDPLGLHLDVSQMGGVVDIDGQSDLVTNGAFDTDTDWTKGAGWSISGGTAVAASATSGARINQVIAGASAGKFYQVEFTIVTITEGGFSIRFDGQNGVTRSTAGTFTEVFTSTTGTVGCGVQAIGTASGTVDNLSVREIPGHHAEQATSSHRPAVAAGGSSFDGVDDHLDMPTLPVASMTGHTVLAQVTLDAGENSAILFTGDGAGTYFGIFDSGSSVTTISVASGSPTQTVDGSSYTTRGDGHALIAAGSPAVFKATGVDLSLWAANSFKVSGFTSIWEVDGKIGKLLIMPDATYTANSATIDTWMVS